MIDRLLNELSDDINRQTAYAANERRNLTTMSLAIRNGELYGSSLMNRAFAQAEALTSVPNRHRSPQADEIGRASCRDSVCLYVEYSVVAEAFNKQTDKINYI